MKTIVSISLLIWSFSSFAGEHIEKMISYYVSYEEDSTMSASETKVLISCSFSADYPEQPHTLRYGWNGSDTEAALSNTNELTIAPAIGTYRFQFYYNASFREIETDSIEVKPGVVTHIHLYFQHLYIHHAVKKPVIYLYPETTTAISVDLKTVGALTFTYPLLNNGWNAVAQPDGTLTCNGKNYPYLFWEAEQDVQNPFEIASFEGFVVEGKNALSFLEEKLTLIGFNDRERTDFITFWGPQLAANNYTNITFQFNESCNQYANLSIVPQPENINRVYMVWSKTDVNALDKTITPQVLPTLNRSGFDVLEWGGIEVDDVEL